MGTGSQIKQLYENIDELYASISALLKDADRFMLKKEYHPTHENSIRTEQSGSLNIPERWAPPYVARYYHKKGGEKAVRGLGVFFTDAGWQPINPMVVFGIFTTVKDRERGEPWFLRYGWCEQTEKYDIGEVISVEPDGNYHGGGKVIVIPLDEIKDTKTLKEKVIDRLVQIEL